MSDIIRVDRNKNYTVMGNYHLRDKNLSNKARGLLSTVLSLPPEWDYTVRGLVAICKDGVESITSQLKELERYGYLTRNQVHGTDGKFSRTEYTFREKPCTGFPYTVNPAQINTDKVNTEYIPPVSLDKSKDTPQRGDPTPKRERKRFTPPKLEEVEAYCRSRQNGIDAAKFVDYYEAVGWKVGKQPMKDWKAAIRTWERRDASNASSQAKKEEAYRAPVCVGFDEEGRGIYK